MNNDAKIASLLNIIKEKRAQLGDRPRANWLTNGIIISNGSTYNLNTINSMDKCVEIMASYLFKLKYTLDARLELGITDGSDSSILDIKNSMSDIKLKASIIKYDNEAKKISVLEKQLKDMRSEDARTADAISDIEELLK